MPRYSHQMRLCISVDWHVCYGAWNGQGKRLSVGEDLSWPRKYDDGPPLRRGDYLRPSMPESRTNYTLSHYITYSISTLQESVRQAYVTVPRPTGSPTPNAILPLAHDPAQSPPRAYNQTQHRPRSLVACLLSFAPFQATSPIQSTKSLLSPSDPSPNAPSLQRHRRASQRTKGDRAFTRCRGYIHEQGPCSTSRYSSKQSNQTCNELEESTRWEKHVLLISQRYPFPCYARSSQNRIPRQSP